MKEDKEVSYFAIIPANVRYDKELTANAKLLYGEISALTHKEGYCYASNNYFAELYGVTPQAISKWVKLLEDKGYVRIVYLYNGLETKERRIYMQETVSQEPKKEVSTNDEEGINEGLKGYQQKVKDNNTQESIQTNNTNSSPQSSESSYKDSLPQEENSKSHYEPFSPSKEILSDSESLPKRKRNSKSHCGSATEEKETSEFKQVKDLYLKNYNTLVEQKIITAQKFSQKQWQSFGATINQNIAKYGLESVLKILTNSFDDDFCRRSGYILTTIFHTNIAPRLLVAPNYYPNSFNKQSSSPRSCQQPRQFDDNHLFF